jgi:hypothetical protein
VKFDFEVCGKSASIQVFYNNNGDIKYSRARHYKGRMNGKPQFEYHQQSLAYIQRKLNEMPKETYPNISNKSGHIGQNPYVDLDKAESSTILKNSWASSSVRIEHQPPKLGVEGSNPSPPATDNPRPFLVYFIHQAYLRFLKTLLGPKSQTNSKPASISGQILVSEWAIQAT